MDKAAASAMWILLRKRVVVSVASAAAFVAILASTGVSTAVYARGPVAGVDTVALGVLPAEAQQTRGLIQAGGPFPYAKDGVVFGNFERVLPRQTRGFYREYTVPTPGLRHRGARRIVCGGQRPTQPDACYYTADHYASFKRIAP